MIKSFIWKSNSVHKNLPFASGMSPTTFIFKISFYLIILLYY